MDNMQKRLVDSYQRPLNYLRISITDRCNLRCLYCMPSSGMASMAQEEILTYEELYRLARIAAGLGVSKIRLTGGEPLVRRGIYDFIPRLTAIEGLEDVSLTTNGVLLKDNLDKIRTGGIRRINISLDTLKRERYRELTGFDQFQTVWKAMHSALNLGFSPVRINMVVIKGFNDDEIVEMAELSKRYPFHVRFIEYMPVGHCSHCAPLHFIPSAQIKQRLMQSGDLLPVLKSRLDGPAERFRFEKAAGEIGFISPMSHHFCDTCNRLRLTASGQLRPCLLTDTQIDIKGPMRAGAADDELADIFLHAARQKNREHHLSAQTKTPLGMPMSSIGG